MEYPEGGIPAHQELQVVPGHSAWQWHSLRAQGQGSGNHQLQACAKEKHFAHRSCHCQTDGLREGAGGGQDAKGTWVGESQEGEGAWVVEGAA